MLRLGHGTLKNGRLTYWLMIIVSIVARLCQGLKKKPDAIPCSPFPDHTSYSEDDGGRDDELEETERVKEQWE